MAPREVLRNARPDATAGAFTLPHCPKLHTLEHDKPLFAGFARDWVPEARSYDPTVPIYEFRCGSCGERFERLVPAGTASETCPACGSEETERVLSAQSAPLKLAGSPGSRRKQEGENARLNQRAKADFKERRKKVREARSRGGGES
jgi:putative FmdB family regulatory protein